MHKYLVQVSPENKLILSNIHRPGHAVSSPQMKGEQKLNFSKLSSSFMNAILFIILTFFYNLWCQTASSSSIV